MIKPTTEVPGPGPTSDWARVATIMRISSSPYIFLRPTISASAPKPLAKVHISSISSLQYRQGHLHLAHDSASGGRQLDSGILRSREAALVVVLVDDTQHDGQERHAENVVAVGKETGAGDKNGSDMVPTKWRLVDFSESKTSSLIWIFDMRKVTGLKSVFDVSQISRALAQLTC